MNENKTGGDHISLSVGSSFNADQAAIGKDIHQTKQISTPVSGLTEIDLIALQQILSSLRAQVTTEAPDEQKETALKRINELEEAITDKAPDLDRMEYVRRWFAKNLPTLCGAVTSVIVNPIVGKIVGAAGDIVATDFRQRFS